jgi:hypothetical protein
MTKINQGGVKCKITKKAGQDTTITINLSSIRRHLVSPVWCISTTDGEIWYRISVEVGKGGKDE